ncbi:MAG: hypothetical protein ACYDEX_10690 [Mobilitalea sp.]
MENKSTVVKIITAVSFLVMLLMNILANAIPINNMTTGQISDLYPNLFTPARYTFSIWGLIYLLSALFTIYQLDLFRRNLDTIKPEVYNQIRILFIISSFLNAGWIVAWHYDYIALSLMMSFIILVCLNIICKALSKEELTNREKLLIRLPFSIYFGWITVATIANIMILLVSIRWNGLEVSGAIEIMIILALVFCIVTYNTFKNKDIAYCLTVIWAYVGILVKHTSVTELNGKYPQITLTVIVCIVLFVVEAGYLYLHLLKKKHAK